jgi:hypothetical protein
MKSELLEAAAKLRRHYAAIKTDETFEESPYFCKGTRKSSWFEGELGDDEESLAKAYLAEHPVDDEELVTEEWLRSVGFKEEANEFGSLSIGPDSMLVWETFTDAPPEFFIRTWELRHVKTRGAVRLLCKALGIELKASVPG